jgi:hypothetical protein
MALECSYCGARTTDDASRCPSCLRSTGLIAAPEAVEKKPVTRKQVASVGLALVGVAALASGGVVLAKRARNDHAQAVRRGAEGADADVSPPFERASGLDSLRRAARGPDALAKGRAALDALRARVRDGSHTVSASAAQGVAPSRSIEELSRALNGRDARFTSLDLCRVLYAALDAEGANPTFARRATGSRPDVPPDPSGVLGRYVVIVGGHALDPVDGSAMAQREARPTTLDPAQVSGAMLVQHAISTLLTGDRARASSLVTRAIERWPDGGIPHAARAMITRSGLGDGVDESVMRDLATAVVASGDDPAIHMLRARAAVANSDLVLARTSARAARERAKGWGDAALAHVLAFEAASATTGGRCDALIDAREDWTDDALTACRALTASGAAPPESAPAAERVRRSAADPLRWALAGAALGETHAIPSAQQREYAGWLALAGRTDLAGRVLEPEDSGAPSR